METCVVESQKMYLSTPKSVTYRKHVLRDTQPGEFVCNISKFLFSLNNCHIFSQDINGIELKELQDERCPRISANDLIQLQNEKPDEIAVIDLRSNSEYNRAHLKDSINIPFASISLADVRLEALNVVDLEARLTNKVVVVASNSHENAILVSFFESKNDRIFTLSH